MKYLFQFLFAVTLILFSSCELNDFSSKCFDEYKGLRYEGTKSCSSAASVSSNLTINGEGPVGLLNVTWDGFSFSMLVDKKEKDCSKMEVSPNFTGGAGGLVITKLSITGKIVRDGDTCKLNLTR